MTFSYALIVFGIIFFFFFFCFGSYQTSSELHMSFLNIAKVFSMLILMNCNGNPLL